MTHQEAEQIHEREEHVTVSGGDYEGHGGMIVGMRAFFPLAGRSTGCEVRVLFDAIPWCPWIPVSCLKKG